MDKKHFTKILIVAFLIFCATAHKSSATFDIKEIILIKDDNNEIVVTRNDFLQWIHTNVVLQYDPSYSSQIENTNYCPVHLVVCKLTKNQRTSHTIKKTDLVSIDEKLIKSFVEDLSRKYDKDPIDATFTIEDGKVNAFSLSKDGKKINIEKNTKNILNLLEGRESKNEIQIIYDTTKPSINSNDADKLGIETLIGTGKSNFSGSTASRIHNVQVAASRFDGVLVKPKEEFSFVETLGEVDGEHGYKQELVIKKDKTEPEYGGGVCQVSTTAFRAAIYSGLEITARRNHAYPVHYYNPQGMDATVYIPRPDLRFINNTPGHILIQTEIDIPKRELVFKFYGTDDGRKIEIDGPHILSRETDGSMKTSFTQTVTDKNGNVILDDTFKSNYDSPSKYPQPGQVTITEKPKDWSKSEWKKYKKEHGL